MKKRLLALLFAVVMCLALLPFAAADTAFEQDGETPGWSLEKAAPTITAQPKSRKVAAGTTVTMKVGASGSKLSYQWQYSKDNGATWTNWSGKTAASFTVKASATNNGCLYRCVVKNSSGSARSKAARLTVSGVKPNVLASPKAQTVAVEKSVTFKVAAAGDGLRYQWQYSKNNGKSWTNWDGRTSASVTVKASTTNNGCLYRCVVKNSKGSVKSGSARLTVSGVKPTILTQPGAKTVGVDNTVTFKVVAAGTGLSYQWQYSTDGKTWKNCSSTGYNKASFSFKASSGLNGRQYRCVVKNSKGKVTSSSAKLTVSSLSITTQPTAQKAAVGTKVTFKVAAKGSNLTYQWQYSTDGKTWKNCSSTGYNKASFSFTTNRGLDGRQYRCVVKSGKSSVTSKAAKLTVPQYSAILAGEENYYDSINYLPGPLNDIHAMEGMLKKLRAKYSVTTLPDATKSQVLNAIASYAKNSKSYDMLVFYYSGHGNSSGSLCMVEGNYITTAELASALSQYKGKVLVLLDSCYSGMAIDKSADLGELDAFNQNVIDAFTGYTFVDESEPVEKSGELKQNKFLVLTASSYTQTSASVHYVGSTDYFGAFTYGFLDALGCEYPDGAYNGSMPGDTNSDSRITLGEMYNHVCSVMSDIGLSQRTQYYGSTSEVLFRR